MGPEVQRVAGTVAVEAAEDVLANVGREATLVVVRCPIADRARATPLISTRLMRLVANQMKNFGDRNLFSNRPIVKPIHELVDEVRLSAALRFCLVFCSARKARYDLPAKR